MDLGLRGKVAVVMAASEGLGFGSARALAQAGARLGVCGRRADRIEAAARTLRDETGSEVHGFSADVSRAGDSARVIEATLASFGSKTLDVLVNNGGGPPPGPAESFNDAAWTSAFELLVLSNVRACRAAFPHLKERGGAIVNVVSTSVKEPIINLVLSNSLRSAVVGYAKTLSLEWAAHKIRVNNVCPGFSQTRRIEEVIESHAKRDKVPYEEALRRRQASIPAGRWGSIDEFGAVVAFLASPIASYVNGQTVSVDGGATKWMHG